MENLKAQLISLIQSLAVSGYEWDLDIVSTIQKLIGQPGERIGDNLIYKFGNGNQKIFVSAHMDEVGFFISKIQNDYISIMPIGSIDIKDCISRKLAFDIHGKRVVSKSLMKSASFSVLKVKGVNNAYIGAVGTFEKNIITKNNIIKSPSLDNKVGCLALIEIIKNLKQIPLDKTIYFCFACREEVSVNGVMAAVKKINPDICIDIDSAYAKPIFAPRKRNNWQVPEIGKGPAIQLIGNGFIISSKDRKIVEAVAEKNKIPYQYEIPDQNEGGTNASTLINAGYRTMQINIPVANQHSAESISSIEDIKLTIELLKKLIFELIS